MVELITMALVSGAFIYTLNKQFERQSESIKKISEIADGQTSLSKELLQFIDKNIHERVIYATPDVPYTSKIESEEETETEDDEEETYEQSIETLMEMNKDYHKDQINTEEGE